MIFHLVGFSRFLLPLCGSPTSGIGLVGEWGAAAAPAGGGRVCPSARGDGCLVFLWPDILTSSRLPCINFAALQRYAVHSISSALREFCGMAGCAHAIWFPLITSGTKACQLTRCRKHYVYPVLAATFLTLREILWIYRITSISLQSSKPPACTQPPPSFFILFNFVSATDFKTVSGKPAAYKR